MPAQKGLCIVLDAYDKMNKILTIIIPTYNMEKYLRKCLDSLIVSDKNMDRLEVLIINDGSKDSSSAIGHEYEIKHSHTFRVIDKENGNYGSCINRGLKEATGKYVKVLDADDYFDTSVFDAYINYLVDVNSDLIISDFGVVGEKGEMIATYTFPLPVDRKFSKKCLSEDTITWLWHHGMTYQREMLLKMGYSQTEGISYTDDEWIFKPMLNVHEISYFPQLLYYYLRGREGQTFDPKVLKKTFYAKLFVLKSLLNFYNQKENVDSETESFLFYKLVGRIVGLYMYYLIKYSTDEYNEKLKFFDLELKDSNPALYSYLDKVSNSLGWEYIRLWRKTGYDRNIWQLLVLRLKYRITNLLVSDSVPRMSDKSKRQN